MVQAVNVARYRDKALNDVGDTKAEIKRLLDSGDRDWQKLFEAVGRYTSAQDCADVLSGQSRIDK